EQLTAIAHTYWNFAVANRELHKLMFNTLGPSTGKVFRYYPKSYKLFLETLKHGTQTGKIKFSKAGYHAIARTMWAWIYGLLVLELTGLLQRRNKNSDPVEEGVYFFLKLLKQGEA
ncbi:MAG: WHG domain-containing protein, partial [Leptospiraceae bacterium]|nr:WHG domain-containing protein [Leptospiraceae bacterium]